MECSFKNLLTTAMLCSVKTMFAADPQRPNILFVYTDDQRYDLVGVVQREQGEKGRYPWFKTPNMDRLAEEGVRFSNAFVTSSLSSPSRASLLTGQYNHLNGVASNYRHLPMDNVTYASLLQENGYTTAYFGKWHMDDQRERPGFDFHASFIGQGIYVDCPLLVQGVETPTNGWVDDITTDYAIEFMEKQKGPWMLAIGFKAPHMPSTPPERAKNRFAGEKARVVPNLFVHAIFPQKQGIPFWEPVVEDGFVPARLDYFRCVSACDDNLGRLLDALDQLGFTDNTIVIYTSDNGLYFGEHGLGGWDALSPGTKRSAYDESLRVPFLVRFPKLGNASKGVVVEEPILNIDLAPTLLDYAGVVIPKEMQGKSWRPLLEGDKPAEWRKSWFYEYFAENTRIINPQSVRPQDLDNNVVDIMAVRSLDTKLIKYSIKSGVLSDWTEMFDIVNDPYELHNLYNDPAHAKRQQEIELEYEKLYKEVGYTIPYYVSRPDWWEKGKIGPDPVKVGF